MVSLVQIESIVCWLHLFLPPCFLSFVDLVWHWSVWRCLYYQENNSTLRVPTFVSTTNLLRVFLLKRKKDHTCVNSIHRLLIDLLCFLNNLAITWQSISQGLLTMEKYCLNGYSIFPRILHSQYHYHISPIYRETSLLNIILETFISKKLHIFCLND